MANYYFGKASVGGNWSNTANWWLDSGRTIAAGSTPTSADDVYLDIQSGNCTVDVAASCARFYTVSYDGFTLAVNQMLSFRAQLYLDGMLLSTITFGAAGKFRYDGTIGDAFIRPKLNMVFKELELWNPTTSNRAVTLQSNSSVISLLNFNQTSTGNISFINSNVEVFIDGYQTFVAGSTKPVLNCPSSSASYRQIWRADLDVRDFSSLSGYFTFGYDADVQISLDSNLTRALGVRWFFLNASSADIRISLATPDGQGGLYLTQGLFIQSEGTGDILIDFSPANMAVSSYFYYCYEIDASTRTTAAARVKINWGNGNSFGIKRMMLLQGVTDFLGGDVTLNDFYYEGDTTQFYYGPNIIGGVNPVDDELPGNITIEQYTGAGHSMTMAYGVNIAGSVNVLPTNNRQTVQFSTLPAYRDYMRIGGNLIGSSTAPLSASYYLQFAMYADLRVEGDVSVTATNNYINFYPLDATVDIFGDFSVAAGIIQLNVSGRLDLHCRKNEEKQINFGIATTTLLDGTFSVVQDDPTDQGGSYTARFLRATTAYVDIDRLELINKEDEPMIVQFYGDGINELWRVRALTVIGRGAVCESPIPTADLVQVEAQNPAAKPTLRLVSRAASYVTLAKFTNLTVLNDNIPADDGTCVDGGGNTGIDFTVETGPSLGVCQTLFSFFGYYKGPLPVAQFSDVDNLDSGILATLAFASVPSWLDTAVLGVGNAQSIELQPNTTELEPGLYEDSIEVGSSGAKRSPVAVDVEYTIAYGVVPIPTPEQVDFYHFREQIFPDPALVDVVNAGAGFTDVMEEIEVFGIPAWLDVEINPPSSSSSSSPSSSSSSGEGYSDYQQLQLSINATGLALPPGTYTAELTIDAPNADGPDTLIVTLEVESAIIVSDPTSVEFEMKEGSSLPLPEVVEIGNSSDGTLANVVISGLPAWLTAARSGSGNAQYIEFSVNAAAQALLPGEYTADIDVDAINADNTLTIAVKLIVTVREFILDPDVLEFTPTDRWIITGTKTTYARDLDFPITVPVVVTNIPDWLLVTINPTALNNQVIVVGVIQDEFDKLDDPSDYAHELLVTAKNTGESIEFSLPLLVKVRQPAFFRRPNCDMDFIPRVEGTLVDGCDVPPPPPPLPRIPTPPPSTPATFSVDARFDGAPCLECTLVIEEVFGIPTVVLECTEHGCYPPDVAGRYCEGDNYVVTEIELDECGHVCEVLCEFVF